MSAYIPFGTRPRICIGLSFAFAEEQIVLATLLGKKILSIPNIKLILPIGRATTEPSHEPLFQLNSV